MPSSKLFGLAFISKMMLTTIATIFVVLVVIVNALNLKSNISEAEISWQNYSDKAIVQLDSLSSLRNHFGYGGFIHSFKNYVLRRDIKYAQKASESIELVSQELDKLNSHGTGYSNFNLDIVVIRNVLDAYKANLTLMLEQPKSISSIELDNLVRIDDSHALKAMETLNTSIRRNFVIKKEASRLQIRKIKDDANLALLSALIIIFTATVLLWMIWRGEHSARLIQIEREKAEKSTEAKTAVLATMSHEIRTPLTALLGVADLLKVTKTDETQKKYIDIILSSGHHLSSILNDILDISKLTANKVELIPTSFKVDVLAEMIASMYSPAAQSSNLELKVQVDEAIKGVLLLGDLHKIRQILFNLVGNAIKFTDEGSVTLIINQKNQTSDQLTLLISVIDTGIGIHEDQLEHVFDEFSQVEDYKEKSQQGTGLGLAICKKLINLMDGRIYATSEIGVGTTFNCEISIKKDLTKNLSNVPGNTDFLRSFEPTAKPLTVQKVLIVDDNKINRMIVSAHLKKWSIDFDTAEDGEQALEKITNNKYDIVLLDIHMPTKTGLEVIAEIPSHIKSELRVYAFTADLMIESIEKYKRIGFDGTISKPFNIEDLKSIVGIQ
ncbi:ATP-binding protein [Kiloniella antarctica]|uniref:histidine kinase n=1 Tax=Kiloniella antarctica TaxID=1550907 RepID=A0ABW5BLP7_9PROT